jgi:gluconolactonase
MEQVISRNAKIEVLAEGFRWSEGPLWVPKLNGLLFSDVPNNKVYLWKEDQGLTLFLDPSGMTEHAPHSSNSGANGLRLDSKGNLILCQHGDRAVARLSSWGFESPQYEVLVDHYKGKWLNSPNDLVFDKKGNLYFTDPPYGLNKLDEDPLKELPFNGIFKWNPKEGIQLLSESMNRPNGILLSKDEKTVYVGNSDPNKNIIVAFDLVEGRFENERVFFDGTALGKKRPGNFDGLRMHSSGIVFSTGPGGVLLIDSDGAHLGTILPGKLTANCEFDADENYLYLTSADIVARIKLK